MLPKVLKENKLSVINIIKKLTFYYINKKSINWDYLLEQKKFPMYYSAQNLHLKMNLQIKLLENLK